MLKGLFFSKSLPNTEAEDIEILRLIRSENVGPRTFFALVNYFGSVSTALENIGDFSLRGGRFKSIKVYPYQSALKELELLAQHGAKIISYRSPKYSKLLCQIPDFPPIISYKGNIELLNEPSLAIVGARNSSINGGTLTAKLAKELVEKGYAIVSGFARGIDFVAHKTASPRTVAVLAGGIDHIYPQEHYKLYEQLTNEGLVVAELPIGAKPLSQHFPQRNRIISGLSLGVLVVEATLKSGSLITARFALEQNREVFAVPGFPLDPRSYGTNKLIKDGAYLVESVNDIISNLPEYDKFEQSLEDSKSNINNFQSITMQGLDQINDDVRKAVLSLISAVPIDFDNIVETMNLPIPLVCGVVLELELAGKVIRCPGNRFCLRYQ